MSPRSNRKPALGRRLTSQKYVTSISFTLEPATWSRDTGQRTPWFDRCQLTITWMCNIKEVNSKPRLHVCQPSIWSMAAMLHDSDAVVVTMRKFIDGFPFLSHMSMGLRLAALRAAGAPLEIAELRSSSI